MALQYLISNSLKYAFPKTWQGNGEIYISMSTTKGDNVQLIICDNGFGIPKNLDFRNTESLGLHLMTVLVEDQLDGKINLNRKEGTQFQINFRRAK